MKVKDRLAALLHSFFAIDKKENPAPPMAQGVLPQSDKAPSVKNDGENK